MSTSLFFNSLLSNVILLLRPHCFRLINDKFAFIRRKLASVAEAFEGEELLNTRKMDLDTTDVAGDLTTSTTKVSKDGHHRNSSVDSGFDASGVTATASSAPTSESDSTMTDLSQENETTDHTPVRHIKLLKTMYGSTLSNQSSDSAVGGSIDESMEMDDGQVFGGNPCLPEKTSECEMDTRTKDDPLQQGEDCPDFPESMVSQAVRIVYSTLVEVISNEVSIDNLASDLYTHRLIEHTVHDVVKMQSMTDVKKTRTILDAVMSKLRTSLSVKPFDLFMRVLDSYPSCRDLVVQIQTEYDQQLLLKNSEDSSSDRSNVREESLCSNSRSIVLQHQFVIRQSPSQQQPNPFPGAIKSSDRHFSIRQRSMSSGAESDVYMTEEEIQQGIRRLAKGIRNYANRNKKPAGPMEEILHRMDSLVVELQAQVEEYSKKIERCDEEKQLLHRQLHIARKQILQLNMEVIGLKRPKQHSCTDTCEHKIKCKKLEKQIERLEQEKTDYVAKIETLTQRIDLLFN